MLMMLVDQHWKASVHNHLWPNDATWKATREAHLHQHLLLLLPWHPAEEDRRWQERHEEDSKGEVDVKFRLTHPSKPNIWLVCKILCVLQSTNPEELKYIGCSASLPTTAHYNLRLVGSELTLTLPSADVLCACVQKFRYWYSLPFDAAEGHRFL